MAFVSAKTIILFRSCFLWSFAYLLVAQPRTVTDHPLVVVMAQAMQIPPAEIERGNQLVGLLSVVLISSSLADLPLLATEGSSYLTVNSVVVPVRLLIFFVVTGWAYLSVDNEYLHNSIVFSYGFAEIVINFLIYAVVREERNEVIGNEIKSRHQD